MDEAEKVHNLVSDQAFELASLRSQRGLLDVLQSSIPRRSRPFLWTMHVAAHQARIGS
jgi:hypothetical protein